MNLHNTKMLVMLMFTTVHFGMLFQAGKISLQMILKITYFIWVHACTPTCTSWLNLGFANKNGSFEEGNV